MRRVAEVRVFNHDPAKGERFARSMTERLQLPVTRVDSAEAATRDADVCITITDSKEPVLCGESVRAGTHVYALGSVLPEMREVDTALVQRSAVFGDSIAHCLAQSGDLSVPIEEGTVERDTITEIGEVLAGGKKGRVDADQITLFKSVGLGIQDLAVAPLAYRLAKERRLGTEVALSEIGL